MRSIIGRGGRRFGLALRPRSPKRPLRRRRRWRRPSRSSGRPTRTRRTRHRHRQPCPPGGNPRGAGGRGPAHHRGAGGGRRGREQGQVLARLSRDILEATLAQNTAALARAEAGIAQAQSQIVQAGAAQTEAAQALDAPARSCERRHHRGRNSNSASPSPAAEGRLAAARNGLQHGRGRSAPRRRSSGNRGPARPHRDQGAAGRHRQPQDGPDRRHRGGVRRTALPHHRGGRDRTGGRGHGNADPALREGASAQISMARTARSGDASATCCRKWIGRPASGRFASRSAPTRPCASAPSRAARSKSPGAPGSPSRSPRSFTAGATAQVVADNKVQSRRVGPACRRKASSRSRPACASGELVVAKAGSFLRDGDTVRAVVSDQTAQAAAR